MRWSVAVLVAALAGLGLAYTAVVAEETTKGSSALKSRALVVSPDAIEIPLPSRQPGPIPELNVRIAAVPLEQHIPAGSSAQSAAITSASEKLQIQPVKIPSSPAGKEESIPLAIGSSVGAGQAAAFVGISPVLPVSPTVSATPAAPEPGSHSAQPQAPAAPVTISLSDPVPATVDPASVPDAPNFSVTPDMQTSEEIPPEGEEEQWEDPNQYRVGVDDVIEIGILQPEQFLTMVTVTPDGYITFPYIGTLRVKDLTLAEVQDLIVKKLADGYMRYPVVTVALKESRSRKFFVYGEVTKPGNFPMEEQMTVLRAISVAGGFTKYSNTSKVKVLRPNVGAPGYEALNVNIKAVMSGNSTEDLLLQPGDMVVVSEGMF